MNQLTEFEKGYIAGIIDGEGSIFICHFESDKLFRAAVSTHMTKP